MQQTDFGITRDGKIAHRFLLTNRHGMRVEVSDFGALVLSVFVPDRYGTLRDVVLGYKNLADYYSQDTGFGAYIGRNANRIAGAAVVIEGIRYPLDKNDGENNIHSGFNRSHDKLYAAEVGRSFVEFRRISPHLEQGFPGDLEQTIRYTLTDNNEFIIDYRMRSNRTTVVNPTNHSYFNLNGHCSGTILSHKLEIPSGQILETDTNRIPTGNLVEVAHTPFDFRSRKPIGQDIAEPHTLLQAAHGYDHNYIFPNDRRFRKMACLYAAESGIAMEVFSDLCGLQVYTANFLDVSNGKENAVYGKHCGVCFETQFYPNACNDPRFPSPILPADQEFASRTVYRFVRNSLF